MVAIICCKISHALIYLVRSLYSDLRIIKQIIHFLSVVYLLITYCCIVEACKWSPNQHSLTCRELIIQSKFHWRYHWCNSTRGHNLLLYWDTGMSQCTRPGPGSCMSGDTINSSAINGPRKSPRPAQSEGCYFNTTRKPWRGIESGFEFKVNFCTTFVKAVTKGQLLCRRDFYSYCRQWKSPISFLFQSYTCPNAALTISQHWLS